MTDEPIWRKVYLMQKENKKMKNQIGEARATLLVNFGPEGRINKLLDGTEEFPQMMIKVLQELV